MMKMEVLQSSVELIAEAAGQYGGVSIAFALIIVGILKYTILPVLEKRNGNTPSNGVATALRSMDDRLEGLGKRFDDLTTEVAMGQVEMTNNTKTLDQNTLTQQGLIEDIKRVWKQINSHTTLIEVMKATMKDAS